jgi:hypothetical protein
MIQTTTQDIWLKTRRSEYVTYDPQPANDDGLSPLWRHSSVVTGPVKKKKRKEDIYIHRNNLERELAREREIQMNKLACIYC